MDWLRSEDLKEEKNVTAPVLIIAVESLFLPRPLPFRRLRELLVSGSACPAVTKSVEHDWKPCRGRRTASSAKKTSSGSD
jgi:hypothetical protein